jgi:hypothetical protein
MLVNAVHERHFAYEALAMCERNGFILDADVTAGIVHGSVALNAVCDRATKKLDLEFVTMGVG